MNNALLNAVGWLGNTQQINDESAKLVEGKKSDPLVLAKARIFANGNAEKQGQYIEYFAQEEATKDVLKTIGTENQKVDISAENAKVIRAILDIEVPAVQTQPEQAQTQATDAVQQPKSTVENCIDASIEALRSLRSPIRDLSDVAVRMFAQDELLAAGPSSEMADELFKARAKTGYEYAVVEEGTTQLETPFIAYMQQTGDEVGHTVTVTSYKDNEVTYIDGTETITKSVDEFKAEGFTGLVLAQKGIKGLYYLDSGVNNAVEEMFRAVKSRKYEPAKEMLTAVINGVTAPEELNKALDYVLAIWSKDEGEMLKYIGLDLSALGDRKAIVQGATDKIAEVIELGKKGELQPAEVKVEIALITTLRDLLIVAGEQGNNWLQTATDNEVRSKLIVSKAVNQNVIASMFAKGVKGSNSVTDASSNEFVIDVKKLQRTIVDKNIKFAKNAKIEEVMDILKDKKTNKFITPLMRLSDIHAVAASA